MAADVFTCSPRRPRSRVRSVLLKPQVPEDDDDSDTDEPSPPPTSGSATSARAHANATVLPSRAGPGREEPPRRQQIIHSGHFMVSSPHREHPPKKGYDFDTVNKQTCQTYSFGKTSSCHLSIDASLTKLFECMTLAYSGKLVSPKWKNFKGLKLQWRDKIRLNNAIWRAWYMQYLEKRKNPVCHFVTPLDGSVDVDEHRRPEAITTEGKYWKSRIEIVIREYHKWRTYFKKRLQQHKDEDLSSLAQDDDMLYWHKHGDGWKTPVPMEEEPLLDTDMLMSEFSDTLFSTLSSHQPVAWPNPREIAHLGNADMIQPGLIPLQPNLDFMDTFEPFQDLFSSSRSIFGSVLPAPASASAPDPSNPPAQGSILSTTALPTVSLPDSLMAPSSAPSLDPTDGQGCERASHTGDPFIQPTDFGPSESSLSVPQPFLPVITMPLLSPSPAPAPIPSALPLVSPPATAPNPSSPPAFLQPQKFSGVSKSPPVITHTASATLTHDASATTFSQSQGLVITAHQPTSSASPCSLALSPVPRLPTVRSPHPRLAFVHPKPVSLTGGRPKQPPKIVPAPKPEPVSLVLKNACLAPAAFSGQPQTVIMTSGPLKRERMLASTVSQSSVVIAPAAIARASGVTEFHSSILVTDLSHSTSSQPTPVSRLFSPSTVQDSLVKDEQVALHGGSPQVPATGSRHLGNADMVQPGLIPLQPNLDFMDTFEPFQDLFSSSRSIFGSVLPAPASASAPDPSNPPAQGPGVTEFHSSILVTDLSHSTSSQPTPVSRLFSPSTVQDSLVKGEQVPLHGGSPQVPPAGSSRDCPNSGQASPCASEQSPNPQSPQNNCSGKSADPKNVSALKNRQMKHISAEQKRRFNIKMGFDTLNSLISNNSKPTSHAITLQKTMEYITKLQQERSQMQEEARRLRDEIEDLNATILSCQQLLPATGVPVTRLQSDHMRDMFDEYVKSRTLQNWKFWIFSIIIKPLFESFKGMVSTSSLEELHRTAMSWLDQHCSLPILRPMVLSTLRQLSTTTSILTDPSKLPEQASEAVTRIGKRSEDS
ncbi:MLX-interacting protein isoform X1 [Castor canadensis]|uniref:MLX-interacting protein isoform X1 n=1 Tax=Castor canadensis TaxID=51338 RepID=A0A8B7UFC0_CASCN